ncbi:MAG: NmrA/HSCARG family protein [Bryobacteraceae bacterium]|nr:NmrA/HSCARG family protein [Bryobacteraceae bacterium]
MSKKIIAICGATGSQGGGLARAILAQPDSPFAVRALTRNPGSEKARELAAAGAEVVAADVDDPASLAAAFAGAHGAYCVTFFWEHFSPERELAQARYMAEAARAQGLAHVIWSTLEDTRKLVPLDDPRMPTLMDRYKVPHFDVKGEADAFFAGLPVTYLLTSFYWENFIHFGMAPKRGADGVLSLALPIGERPLPGIASDDIGRAALAIFAKGSEFIGQTVGIASEHLTGSEFAIEFSRALGERVRYDAIPFDAYRSFGFPGAEDLGNMFQYKHDFSEPFCWARDPKATRRLLPSIEGFDDWLERNLSQIPIS